ncbi:MAG: hypothetical protein AAF840_02970 [Bacteroidota bacterium]
MRFTTSFSSLCFALFLTAACTADQLPEPVVLPCDGVTPTYEADVREIVERTCAYSGCHLGGAPGIYDSYQGLLPDLESGLFRQRVIDRKDDPVFGMPPNYAPSDREVDLTAAEIMLITCWLEAGHPE